jgi:hypothetical protein
MTLFKNIFLIMVNIKKGTGSTVQNLDQQKIGLLVKSLLIYQNILFIGESPEWRPLDC